MNQTKVLKSVYILFSLLTFDFCSIPIIHNLPDDALYPRPIFAAHLNYKTIFDGVSFEGVWRIIRPGVLWMVP